MSNLPIEQSELWEISRRLVGFDTVSEHSNLNAAQYLANYLEESGFTVRQYEELDAGVQKAMIVAWAGPAVHDGLIISGHIDVVPFAGQPGWQTDPLTLTLGSNGQHIFGRGVSDMKVFLAQAVLAARKHPLDELKRPLVFIFTCDEEVAVQGSERLVRVLPDYFRDFPLPKIALIGEPTNFEVYSAHKGYATFDILVHGKGGHSSVPGHGLNAIAKMADVIHEIEEMNHNLQQQASPDNRWLFPESPTSVFNCGLIHGGLAPNMIAETCRLTTSIRVAPGDNAEEIVKELQKRLDQAIGKEMRKFAPDCGIFVENFIAVPPVRSPTEGPFCDLLSRVMGKRPERGAAFSTDGGHFQVLGITPYVCGPGLISEAHKPNESLPVANFFTGLERLETLIYEWCISEDC
jgi:acetylornithine deacetylase